MRDAGRATQAFCHGTRIARRGQVARVRLRNGSASTSPHSKTMWRSLPPIERTREIDDVRAFFGVRDPESGIRDRVTGISGGSDSAGGGSTADATMASTRNLQPRSMRGHRNHRRR